VINSGSARLDKTSYKTGKRRKITHAALTDFTRPKQRDDTINLLSFEFIVRGLKGEDLDPCGVRLHKRHRHNVVRAR
jgi:hypothetical protein